MSSPEPIAMHRSVLSTTIESALREGARALAVHSDSAQLDAELLLGKALGIGRSALIARGADRLGEEQLRTYRQLLDERKRGTPVAYLTGLREFWSLPLKVTPAVLVPRPETELLVELALQRLPQSSACTALDLGTGSGAVALAIASERPRARVVGIDVSCDALSVARENAATLALPHVSFRLGSWFDAVPGEEFDLVVANPPYIAAGDPALAALAAEPLLALVAGAAGLDALELIIAHAPAHMTPGGWLLVEHGSAQQHAVARLFEHRGFTGIECHADYSGLPRITRGTFPPPLKERS